MLEVEIKLPLGGRSASAEEQLLRMGFLRKKRIQETDVYFDNAAGDIRRGDKALRLRTTREQEGGALCCVITWKGRKEDEVSSTRRELETAVGDEAVLRSILEELGCRPVPPAVEKHRTLLTRGDITACLDTVKGLGDFLELEKVIPESDDMQQALQGLEEILHALGCSMQDTVRQSYLSQLQALCRQSSSELVI